MLSFSKCRSRIFATFAILFLSSCAAEKYSNEPAINSTQQGKFEISSTNENPNQAVIFVGGIHNTYHYWDPWKESVARAEVLIVGYKHDHSSATMPNAAHELAEEIETLRLRGVTDVSIVAHSMGGLIAKAALDEIAAQGKASDFNNIELHAFGTPWGGFSLADIVRYLPAAERVSMTIGYPMGPDIGPGSDFMKNLSRPLPSNCELYVYLGSADTVAKPDSPNTRQRFAEIEAIAKSTIIVEGYEHTDYWKVNADLIDVSRKLAAGKFELGVPKNYVVAARHIHVRMVDGSH